MTDQSNRPASLADKIYGMWESESTKAKQLAALPGLSPSQLDCLQQLVTPVYDGNLMSKQHRTELVNMGLVARWNGLNFCTQDGYVVLDALTILHDENHKFKGGFPWKTYKRGA